MKLTIFFIIAVIAFVSGDVTYQEATKNQKIEKSMIPDVPKGARTDLAQLSKIAGTIAGYRKDGDAVQKTFPLVVDAEDLMKNMVTKLTDPLQHEVVEDALLPWVELLDRNDKEGKTTWTSFGEYYIIKNAVLEALLQLAKSGSKGDNTYQEATEDAKLEESMVAGLSPDAQPHMKILAQLANIVAIDRKNNDIRATYPLVPIAEEQIDELLKNIPNPFLHGVLKDVLLPWLEKLGKDMKSGNVTWRTFGWYYGIKNGVLEALIKLANENSGTKTKKPAPK